MSDLGGQPQAQGSQTPGLGVASRVIHLDPGWFSLSMMPSPGDRATGLPSVRVCLPPSPPGRREAVTINPTRGDGWMTGAEEPILLRVAAGGAEVLVTQYWLTTDPASGPPALKLARLNPEALAQGPDTPAPGGIGTVPGGTVPGGTMPGGHGASGLAAPRAAEIVAHVEGVGDVDGRLGEWIGMRGSGRAIEGFGLTSRPGFSTEDFDIRAVLGRDWLSPWLPGGNFLGSRGLALPLRGFSLRLHPAAAARLEFACLARFVDGSEVGPVGSDRIVASANLAALEAFQLVLRPRLG